MPRTRSLAWSELKIGVLTIAALVIAAVLIFSLTGTSGFFWQRYSLKTRFPNVAGLAPGSPVRVAGVEVGSVTGIDFAGEQVDVTFEAMTAQISAGEGSLGKLIKDPTFTDSLNGATSNLRDLIGRLNRGEGTV